LGRSHSVTPNERSAVVTNSSRLARIRLAGGPSDLPDEQRTITISAEQDVIKFEHRGGYEHFHRTVEKHDEEDGRAVIFRWVWRTRIAE
jgi:hypothetical protein